MGRRKGGAKIDGWLNVDKPLGLSSAAVVAKVRKLTGAAKIGHGGTLDPLASGILPLALGEATKTVAFVMDGVKSYRFRVRWGEATATDDAEGEVTATSPARPSEAAILAALPAFIGPITQIPPAFSAIKIGGKRAYDLARAQEPVEMKPRQVEVHRFDFMGQPDQDHADFSVTCGKGTYIRALGRDLALALGTVGHLAQLRRTAVGPFGEDAAICLDKLAELWHSPAASDLLLSVVTALDDIPALALTEAEAQRLKNGQSVPLASPTARFQFPDQADGVLVRAMAGEKLVALGHVTGGAFRPTRVLNL